MTDWAVKGRGHAMGKGEGRVSRKTKQPEIVAASGRTSPQEYGGMKCL